jgi:polyisoprenoid-binding protein YceI
MRPARLASQLALLALASLAGGPAGATEPPLELTVGPGSTLGYVLVHKFHEVRGLAGAIEGKVRLLPDGQVQAMVRARVEAFDSGNGNRDAHMLEVTEAGRYPLVVLKAAGALAPPATTPATVTATLRGEVTFHGVTRPVEVPVTATFTTPRQVTATGRLTLSLEAFGVERPSLLFVPVDDAVVVSASLVLAAEGP